jgi:hypothetical protein
MNTDWASEPLIDKMTCRFTVNFCCCFNDKAFRFHAIIYVQALCHFAIHLLYNILHILLPVKTSNTNTRTHPVCDVGT